MANPNDPNDPNYDPYASQDEAEESDELKTGAPVISAAPSRIFFVLGAVGVFAGIVLYVLFGRGGGEKAVAQPVVEIAKAPSTPVPPSIPQLDAPMPPEAISSDPPAPPVIPVEPPSIDNAGPNDEQRQTRIRSDMLIVNNTKLFSESGKSGGDAEKIAQDNYASSDPNLGFANRAYGASQAVKAYAGTIGDLSSIIAQGKLIHGVLETAINTQLPGTLRAVVSRDIYAEQGKNVLIPKGSRLIGVYNTNIYRGQDRVFIAWTRVIRPDGIDIYVNSPGVDSLGRAGLEGFLDQKFREIFSGALLTSVISIGAAGAADLLGAGDNVSTTVNTDGSSTSTGDPVSFATINAVGNLSSVGRSVVEGLLDLRPTITVDQGTEINVFVNRDLHFPAGLANRTMIIE